MIDIVRDYLSSNPYLVLGIFTAFLFSLASIYTARRAILRDRPNFMALPELRSCFTCDSHFVVRPEYVPQGVMSIVVQKNVLRCREIMQAEVRLPEQDFQREWGFAYDQPQGDYTAIATRCPKFKLIQGGKK